MTSKSCSDCGTRFTCGAGTGSCWCNDFPKIMPLDLRKDCRCPECLKKVVQHKISEFVSTLDPRDPKIPYPPEMTQTKREVEGIDYYLENGFHVFTAWHHLKRGVCCGNGCRHCPYPKKNGG